MAQGSRLTATKERGLRKNSGQGPSAEVSADSVNSGGGVEAAIPLVDLKAQYRDICAEIDPAIRAVFERGEFILGEEVRAFEGEFARYLGAEQAVGVASGTAALHLALAALGVGPGDEVITTAHTFVATAEAICHTGATPVFADIDPVRYTLDPAAVRSKITARTRAVIPVHLYGQPAAMAPLLELARAHGLFVVEDAAQAHGAMCEGRGCGTLGDLACFSFYPGKNLGAYGDAGAVSGRDLAALARVRSLRDHGRSSKYRHETVGFGERLDAVQAAVLRVKLRHLDGWTAARRSHAARYRQLLAGLPIQLPQEAAGVQHVYHLYVIRTERRDPLLASLKARGIEAGVHYPLPVHLQPAFQYLGGLKGQLPETERAAAEVLSLPLYPELEDAQLRHVTETIREFFAKS
jgi:dTDP-4-amino-4,6-dideoxygalactose transaminase